VVESQPSKLLVAGSIPVSRSMSLTRMAFEQATIKVEKPQEFAALQTAIEQAFQPDSADRFLKQLDRKGIRVRDFDGVLAKRALEDAAKEKPGVNAAQLYESLPLSDQAQMREFYLSKLEAIDITLRHKFRKLYQYY
jgi:hypothetical protein